MKDDVLPEAAPGEAPSGCLSAAVGVSSAVVFAFLLRAAGFPQVIGREVVVFAPGDAMYHVRRAYVSFVDFPRVLLWDPYINYPDGAPIPWPPLTDWLYAAIARSLFLGERGFELVLAWGPPVLGALTVIPVYAIARRLGSRSAAIGAAFLYGAIPIAVQYARVGNPDHHVAVAHIGAWMLFASIATIERAVEGRSLVAPALGLFASRVALLFTWHGSLLYLGLLEATLLLAAVFTRRSALAGAQALSLLATVCVFLPILASFPTPLLGPYSSIAPSRLHALALLCAASSAAALWLGTRRWPQASVAIRIAWAGAAALVFGLAVLAFPGPRAGLAPALDFLGMGDAMGAHTAEQFPLFALGEREVSSRAAEVWGHFSYGLAFLPLFALWLGRGRERKVAALVLALWCALFGGLSILQIRYGNDAAPAAAVVFGLAIATVTTRLAERLRWPRGAAPALMVLCLCALLEFPIRNAYLPQLARAAAAIEAQQSGKESEPRTAAAALDRFLRDLRARTPETRGYLQPDQVPEYGVIAQANLGHAIQWVARRPTPTDPFWSYIGRENWDRAFGVLTAREEATALELARRLRARYVITTPGTDQTLLEGRLHAGNGSRTGELPALEHFRLIAQGPRGARTLHAMFARSERGIPNAEVPYKAFEIVEGASIEVDVESRELVSLEAELLGPDGRSFRYLRAEQPSAPGRLRLRVPYPNRNGSPYQLSQGKRRWRARVDESAVRAGSVVHATPLPSSRPIEGLDP